MNGGLPPTQLPLLSKDENVKTENQKLVEAAKNGDLGAVEDAIK